LEPLHKVFAVNWIRAGTAPDIDGSRAVLRILGGDNDIARLCWDDDDSDVAGFVIEPAQTESQCLPSRVEVVVHVLDQTL
jgi:hypothetical protein